MPDGVDRLGGLPEFLAQMVLSENTLCFSYGDLRLQFTVVFHLVDKKFRFSV